MITVNLPGVLADALEGTDSKLIRPALDAGTVRFYGRGYSVMITADASVHLAILAAVFYAAPGSNAEATPAERAAYRTYERRIITARTRRESK